MAESSGSRQEPNVVSPNELSLSRRLAQVSRERDDLAAELATMKLEKTQIAESPAPPAVEVPSSLLPTLSLLRAHIENLTRDNAALRYTFLPRSSITNDARMGTLEEQEPNAYGTTVDVPTLRQHGIDLEDVVRRVKQLVRENEELGAMVLEAGRESSENWEKALEESRAMIVSLDADLESQFGLIQSLQTELASYKSQFGPLPNSSDEAVRAQDLQRGGVGSNTPGPSRKGKEREKDRDRPRVEHNDSRGKGSIRRGGKGRGK